VPGDDLVVLDRTGRHTRTVRRRRPWQVLCRPGRGTRSRSRSSFDEPTASAWAQPYVREVGGDALAHIGFKQSRDRSPSVASAMLSHLVTTSAGELLLRSWPGVTDKEAMEQVRDALMADEAGMDRWSRCSNIG
jgi:hypothetical protein